jgi:hypothetical protein
MTARDSLQLDSPDFDARLHQHFPPVRYRDRLAQAPGHLPPAPVPAAATVPPALPNPDAVRAASAAIAARNAAVIRKSDQRVNGVFRALFALVLGVLGGLALVHWATPCAAGSLCALAAVTPTRCGWWLRLQRAARRQRLGLRQRYLRARIASAWLDMQHLEATADWIPRQQALHQLCIDAWQTQVRDCELAARDL